MKKTLIVLTILTVIFNCSYGQKTYHSSLLLDAKAGLGETAIWHPSEKKLYWIDVDKKTLNTFDPVSKTDNHYPLKNGWYYSTN